MAINLQKGQTVDLRINDGDESVYDLSQVTIGLGSNVCQKQISFFGKIFGGKEEEYDLDAFSLLLDSNGKIADLGSIASVEGRNVALYDGEVIYFISIRHPTGNI